MVRQTRENLSAIKSQIDPKPRSVKFKRGGKTHTQTSSRRPRTNRSPGIAKEAHRPRSLHGEDGPVPMRSISLPLNNPKQAARSMLSLYGEEYMQALAAELHNILHTTKGIEHGSFNP